MSANLRIAFVFVAIFFALGLHMPYFPVWLQSRGLSAESVGLVLGVITWMRVFANPLFGRLSDKLGSVKLPAVALAVGTAASYGLFGVTSTLLEMMAVGVLLGFMFSPLVPLTDSVAIRLGNAGRADYGRLRLWGSAAFIAASKVGGMILERGTEDDILTAVRIAAVVVVLAVVFMPSRGALPPREPQVAGRGKPRRSHVAFLLTTGILHASHAMLYVFGTTHWRTLGVDDATIGSLWSVGVVAEIGLFALGARTQKRLGSTGLLLLAAGGGLLRWPLLAIVTWTPALYGVQLLHACTFAALHLGAMAYVQERVSDEATATVTALYSASSGVGIGLAMLSVGTLYGALGGTTYAVMAGLSACGLVGAVVLARRRRSPQPTE